MYSLQKLIGTQVFTPDNTLCRIVGVATYESWEDQVLLEFPRKSKSVPPTSKWFSISNVTAIKKSL